MGRFTRHEHRDSLFVRRFGEKSVHFTLIVPEPAAGNSAWDVGVTLAATGEVHA